MRKFMGAAGAAAAVALVAAATVARAEDYPARDISVVVVWAAGGGTDTVNRLIAAEMQQHLPARINVVNRTGGVGGSAGMSFVYGQPADGYTLAGISESNVTAGVQGGWDQRFEVWQPFIVGGSPDLVSVSANAPYQTLKELIEAAKAKPGEIRAGASAAGSIHHLNLLALEKGTGAKFNYIPYDGSAPAQNAAVSGEVAVVVTSLAEQQQLIRAKRLRPLAMLTPNAVSVEGIGDVPSAFADFPDLKEHLPIQQAIGFAVRADAPDAVKKTLTDAFDKALQSDKVKGWAAQNFYEISGKSGEAAREEFQRLESLFAWTLHELGAATVSPEKLGIPKPAK
ncbi:MULTISPECIES: tripartite tricarboxylate transporter substrate binding protein [unclassified Chelatococcus]|uniref:tripartite tricarboxylate transporter substrate binding protein n=1 Tax=unclassified Chelatococcus TaxID=2638111 RepID=UPI00030BAD44|nr:MULTISPECIES: tripartite tricarboxylate transporter substrate binding protein [unclassified Chelatococcus]ALA16896.1 tricarboxylate transport protein TctC [Chelatococcus sp. CO-6]